MSEFNSLENALEGQFDKPLKDLPDELRLSVERSFPGLSHPNPSSTETFPSWDILTPAQRRQVARQQDLNNDPALEQERQRAWDAQVRCTELESAMEEWRSFPVHIPSERIAKENRIAQLQQELFNEKLALANLLATGDGTREVGRPSPKALIAAEFERRASQGNLEQGVAAQARALKDWLSANHPNEPQVSADTIEINLRARYREARNTSEK